MRNIEIKARVEDLEALEKKAAAVATSGPVSIVQDDIFFRCASGRLKLRVFPDQSGELIFYRRENGKDPKESFYVRSPVSDPGSLSEAMTLAFGQWARVKKVRSLFLAGRTRIHLDRVENLGQFLELEVVMQEGDSNDVAVREANHLMDMLGIESSQLIDCAYADMLAPAASQYGGDS